MLDTRCSWLVVRISYVALRRALRHFDIAQCKQAQDKRTADRGQRAEGRRQKAEDRGLITKIQKTPKPQGVWGLNIKRISHGNNPQQCCGLNEMEWVGPFDTSTLLSVNKLRTGSGRVLILFAGLGGDG